MAFQGPNVGQEKKNLKILEQLEEQKKRLRGQMPSNLIGQPAVSLAPGNFGGAHQPPVSIPSNQQSRLAEPQHMNEAQSTALQHAHAASFGYFITQNSQFGNLILPVLPRFNEK